MKKLKKCGAGVAVCLSLVMLLGLFPASAFALQPEDASAITSDLQTGEAPQENALPEETPEEAEPEPEQSAPESDAPEEVQEPSSALPEDTASEPAQSTAPASAELPQPLPDGLTDALDSYDSAHLQALIDEAAAGATIQLDGDFVLAYPVTIDKPLTLTGTQAEPITISLAPGATGRHLFVDTGAGGVYLQFLNFVGHGNGTLGGGVEMIGAGTLNMLGITLTGNANPGGNGGGLDISGTGLVEVISSTITDNTAANGGGIYSTSPELYIEQKTRVSQNTATGNGGGVWATELITDNSYFTENSANGDGGGIYVFYPTADYNYEVSRLYGGEVSGNTAGGNGGGVAFNACGKNRLNFVQAEGNTAGVNGGGVWLASEPSGAVYISSTELLGNSANLYGGGVFGGQTLYVENESLIKGNTAAYGGGTATSWSQSLIGSTIDGNTATRAGGGVYMMDPEAVVGMQQLTVSNNVTYGDAGGGVYLSYYTNIYTLYCTFVGNHSARGVFWDMENPLTEEQLTVARDLYPNTILFTDNSAPFTNAFNNWDISFFFDDTELYTITFEPNGGTWDNNVSEAITVYATPGELVTLPQGITRDGAEPTGWYTNPSLTDEWNLATDTVDRDITLYARWPSGETYTATYYVDLGQGYEEYDTAISISEGDLLTPPSDPTRDDYIFDGWYTEVDYSYKWDFTSDTVNNDLELYARWRDDGLVDVLYMDGTSLYYRANDLAVGALLADRPEDPSMAGYIFDGWFTAGGDKWQFETDTLPDEDLILYAQWKDDGLVNILFMLDDATEYSRINNYPVGLTVRPPTSPEVDGRVFLGWYTAGGAEWDFANTYVYDDLTLYARFRDSISYTVEYFDGATLLGEDSQPEGSLLPAPADPTKDGYIFAGWYTDRELATRWDFGSDTVEKNMRLYARWTDDGLVDICYIVDGREYHRDEDIGQGSRLTPPDDPSLDDLVFLGWYKDEKLIEEWDFDTDTADEDTTLYAKWRPLNRYTATYVTGDELVYATDRSIKEGSLLSPPRDPRQSGMLFGGWYTEPELETRWDFDTDTIGQDMTFYARWRDDGLVDIEYRVDGMLYAQEDDLEPGSLLTKPEDPRKEEHAFLGWFTEDGREWSFGADTAEEDTILHAEWRRLGRFSATYIANGREHYKELNILEGSLLVPPTDPVNGEDDDLLFAGWYTDEALTARWDFDSYTIRENTTFYARWRDNGLVDIEYRVDGMLYSHEDDLEPGSLLTKPDPDPQKEEHEFLGWFTEGGKEWNFKTDTAGEDITLHAEWRALERYTATYHANGREHYKELHILEGSRLTPPAEPVNEEDDDFIFGGWYTDTALTTRWDFDTNAIEQDMDFYVRWRDEGFVDVEYRVDGMLYDYEDDLPPGSDLDPPAEPTKAGHVFLGWYTEAGEKWDFDSFTADDDLVLYAQWRALEYYRATYFANDRTYYTDRGIVEGSLLAAPEPDPVNEQDEDLLFAGWYTEPELINRWDFENNTINQNMFFYARWRDNGLVDIEYRVDDMLYGHEDDLVPGSLLTKPEPDPEKDGYEFLGWFTDDSKKWDFASDTAGEDTTLHAEWRRLERYTATYMANGRLYYTDNDKLEGSLITAPPDPVSDISGKLFAGWYSDEELTIRWSFASDTIQEDITLYARWRDDGVSDAQYLVDGEEFYREEDVEDGSLLKGPPNDPEKDGYTFGGWYKDPDLTELWDFATDSIEEDTTLYAGFILDPVEITGYDVVYLVDGEEHFRQPNISVGALLERIDDPVKKGYTFDGWYRGTANDLPVEPLAARALTAPTAAAQELVFWLFDTDTMPEEMLVLIASFTEDVVVIDDPSTTSTGSVGGSGAGTGSSSGAGSSSSLSGGLSTTSRTTAGGSYARYGTSGGSGSTGRYTTSGAQTGDRENTMLFAAAAIAALLLGSLFVLRKRRSKQ